MLPGIYCCLPSFLQVQLYCLSNTLSVQPGLCSNSMIWARNLDTCLIVGLRMGPFAWLALVRRFSRVLWVCHLIVVVVSYWPEYLDHLVLLHMLPGYHNFDLYGLPPRRRRAEVFCSLRWQMWRRFCIVEIFSRFHDVTFDGTSFLVVFYAAELVCLCFVRDCVGNCILWRKWILVNPGAFFSVVSFLLCVVFLGPFVDVWQEPCFCHVLWCFCACSDLSFAVCSCSFIFQVDCLCLECVGQLCFSIRLKRLLFVPVIRVRENDFFVACHLHLACD